MAVKTPSTLRRGHHYAVDTRLPVRTTIARLHRYVSPSVTSLPENTAHATTRHGRTIYSSRGHRPGFQSPPPSPRHPGRRAAIAEELHAWRSYHVKRQSRRHRLSVDLSADFLWRQKRNNEKALGAAARVLARACPLETEAGVLY
jgi:hypothetical protein